MKRPKPWLIALQVNETKLIFLTKRGIIRFDAYLNWKHVTELSYVIEFVGGVSAKNNCCREHLKFAMGELLATERANRQLFYASFKRFIVYRAQMRGK